MIANKLFFEKVINSGRYGQVHVARHVAKNGYYAVKVLPKQRHDLSDYKNKRMIYNEISNMRYVQVHKNIVRLEEVLQDADHFYLVEELCGGQTFGSGGFDGFSEMKEYVGNVIDAVRHCHERDIIYGDLKPANIIFSNKDRCFKLTDFGSSVKVDSLTKEGMLMMTTPAIAAPEVMHSGPVTFSYDVWGIGMLIQFAYQNVGSLSKKKNENVEDFIRMCLEVDASKRLDSGLMRTYWDQV